MSSDNNTVNSVTELVFYHGNCLDGVSAAYCHQQYGGKAVTKYIPMSHNEINILTIKKAIQYRFGTSKKSLRVGFQLG